MIANESKLELIKSLKAKYNIGTWNALAYLRIQREHALTQERTTEYLTQRGIVYSPSLVEVSNVSTFSWDFINYYLSLGQAGLSVLGIDDGRWASETTFAHRRLRLLDQPSNSDLWMLSPLQRQIEVNYQRIVNDFFDFYGCEPDSVRAFRIVARKIIEDDSTPYARDALTSQPFYFTSRRTQHTTLINASRSYEDLGEGDTTDNETLQGEAEEIMEFYRGIDGKPSSEDALFDLDESTLKGLTFEAKEWLLGYAPSRTSSGRYYKKDCYYRAKREGTLHRTEIQRIIALNFCRGEGAISSEVALYTLRMQIKEAQEALGDPSREDEIRKNLEEHVRDLDLDAEELAEGIIEQYHEDQQRYSDILRSVVSNRVWLNKILSVQSSE